MQKYKVTVLKDNNESVLNIRAVGEFQAIKQTQTGFCVDKIVRVETKEQYKKRTSKYNPVMTSSFQSVRSSKQQPVGN